MKRTLITLLLVAIGSYHLMAGEPATKGPQPIKPIEVKAVPGKRINIHIEGNYAGFHCISGNTICFWKIVTESQPKDEPLTCGYNKVDPQLFPAIFEPEKIYLGVYDRMQSLRIIEVKSIEIKCDDGGTSVIITPYVNLDF